MKKSNVVMLIGTVAIATSMYSLYLLVGSDVSSSIIGFANPCLSNYDIFKDELISKGFFDSESTKEQNRAYQNFVTDDCFSSVDSWLPSDRQNEKNIIRQIVGLR